MFKNGFSRGLGSLFVDREKQCNDIQSDLVNPRWLVQIYEIKVVRLVYCCMPAQRQSLESVPSRSEKKRQKGGVIWDTANTT